MEPNSLNAPPARVCTECGWRAGDSPGLQLGAFAWARLVALILTLGIGGALWFTTKVRTRFELAPQPRVFVPALSLIDVRAIAGGTADPALATTFADHVRGLCIEGPKHCDADEAVLGFGFIAPQALVAHTKFGWPEPWYTEHRITKFDDAARRIGEQPFGPRTVPGVPWSFDLRNIHYYPQPAVTGGQLVTYGAHPLHLAFPIAATWLAWWLSGVIAGRRGAPAQTVRRVRIGALIASGALWCALGIALNRVPDEVSGAWKVGGAGWIQVSPLELSVGEALAALDERGTDGIARVAQAIASGAYKDGTHADDALVMCGLVGAVMGRTLHGWVVGGSSGLLSFERTTDKPSDLLLEPNVSGARWSFDEGVMQLRQRPVVASNSETRIRLGLAPFLVLIMALIALWYAAAVIQRRIRAARRARRDCCPRCAYPFPALATAVTTSR